MSVSNKEEKKKGHPQRDGPSNDRMVVWRLADARYVLRRRTLLALHDVELDALALGERLEAATLNRAVVDEAVLRAVLRRNEAEALLVIEPLHRSARTH